jgi:hypothetical protein
MEKHLERQKAYTMLDKGVRFLCLLVITSVLGTVGQRKGCTPTWIATLSCGANLPNCWMQLGAQKFPWIYMDLWLLQLSSSM